MTTQQLQILKSNFGFDSLRPAQIPVIESVLNRQDTLAIMPTGGGKSLCYQFPAILFDGLTVVISPLIALMKDQVESLKESGVWAEYINSSQTEQERNLVWQSLRELNSNWSSNKKLGLASAVSSILESNQNHSSEKEDFDIKINNQKEPKLKLLYIAPEKLFAGESFLEFLSKIKISLFAIDEAHCISNWGHDFRPEYAKLSILKEKFPEVPTIALTATADELTRQDILKKLNLIQPKIFISSFDRPNIHYQIEPKIEAFNKLLCFLKARNGESGIIYCLSRKTTEELAVKLNENGIAAVPYHAKLSTCQKVDNFNDFMSDKMQVITATIAFGMGIDKSNVRFVVHWNLPKNIENYYQETGRAGRDGLPSQALLFYDPFDANILRNFIWNVTDEMPHLDKYNLQIYRQVQSDKLDRLLEFCRTGSCRRRVLLNYFNESLIADCGYCDACDNPCEKINGTVFTQKILSAVYRTNQSFGAEYIINVLTGNAESKIVQNGHHKLPTFGIGKDISPVEWHYFINQLMDNGLLKIRYVGFAKVLVFTKKAFEFIQSGNTVEFVKFEPAFGQKKEKSRKSLLNLDSLQLELFEKLKILRRNLAKKDNVPSFVIFSDASLLSMLRILPVNLNKFNQVEGVGLVKAEKFGWDFINLIRTFKSDNPNLKPAGLKPTKSTFLRKKSKII